MSNCKQVHIAGYMDILHGDDALYRFLGQTVMPQFGLKIVFCEDRKSRRNEHGGSTVSQAFIINGMEAVGYAFLRRLVDLIEKNGWVTAATAQDIEEGDAPVSLMPAREEAP